MLPDGRRASSKPRPDEPLVATHRGLDQRAPAVAGHLMPNKTPSSAPT
jgi:hypothetical protein